MTEENPDSALLEMPDIGSQGYLIELLLEIGASASTGFGVAPLSWSEIYSWSSLTQTNLTSWEASTIMSLSRAFTASYHRFDETNAAAPFVHEEFDRVAASRNIGNALRLLAKRVNKNG